MRLARGSTEDPEVQVELLDAIDEAMNRKQDLSIANAMLALLDAGDQDAHTALWLSTQEVASTMDFDEEGVAPPPGVTDAEHYLVPFVIPHKAVDLLRRYVHASPSLRKNLADVMHHQGLIDPSVTVLMSPTIHDSDDLDRTSFSQMRQMLRNMVANQPDGAHPPLKEVKCADDECVLMFFSFAILYSGGGGLLPSGKIGYARTGDAASQACANAYADDMSNKLRNIIAAQGVNDVELTVGLPQWPYAAIYNGTSLGNAAATESAINHLSKAGRSTRFAKLEPIPREPENFRITIQNRTRETRSFVWMGRHDLESSINEAVHRLNALGVLCVDVSAMHQIAPMPNMIFH